MADVVNLWIKFEIRGYRALGSESTMTPMTPNGPGVRLPDGSGAFVASYPLPKTHWLYSEEPNEPPAFMRMGIGSKRTELALQVAAAARYAVRGATLKGTEMDFDPDAVVQNMVVGLLGYWTEDGLSGRDTERA